MNYQDRLEHLTYLVTEQHSCTNYAAYQLIADALGSKTIQAIILFQISLQTHIKPPSNEPPDPSSAE